jgi:Tol biopolymer transport system component
VFDALVSGIPEIWTVSAEGGQTRRLLAEPMDAITPRYSRDGEWIYFSALQNGVRQVLKAPRRGGAPVQLTVSGGIDAVESFDRRHLYYRKEGVRGVWRIPVGGGAEELVPGTEALPPHRHWDLRPEGFYFFDPEPEPAIRLLDLRTNHIREIASVWALPSMGRGLSVAPDGRTFQLSRRELLRAEIVLAGGFPH